MFDVHPDLAGELGPRGGLAEAGDCLVVADEIGENGLELAFGQLLVIAVHGADVVEAHVLAEPGAELLVPVEERAGRGQCEGKDAESHRQRADVFAALAAAEDDLAGVEARLRALRHVNGQEELLVFALLNCGAGEGGRVLEVLLH